MSFLVLINRWLLNSPLPVWVYNITFKTPDVPIWPVVHGLWCIYLVLASTKGIYNSTKSKFLLTILMSLSQERFMVLLRNARQITLDVKIQGFLISFLIEFIVLAAGWLIIHFLKQDFFNDFSLRVLGLITSVFSGVEKIRIFYFIENYLSSINPQVTMILSIGLAFGPELIEIGMRKMLKNRATSKYTRTKPLIFGAAIFVLAFQFFQKGSTLSHLFGNIPITIILQYLNFTLPLYYLCLFVMKK